METTNRIPTAELDALTLSVIRSTGETNAASVARGVASAYINGDTEYMLVPDAAVRRSLERHVRAGRLYSVLVRMNAPVYGRRECYFYGIPTA